MSNTRETAVDAPPLEKDTDQHHEGHTPIDEKAHTIDYEKNINESDTSSELAHELGEIKVIVKAENVAIEVLGVDDDPTLPAFTFRTVVLGIGLSAFASV